ncbi:MULTISPECIES: YdeI/OmpD-associated family protein [Streptomyces]|uniref:YdeI/OmpD-associated family protein n=1 Tax=Streptomyces solicathayae TaxID=3081768 RepID=A0ABZ0M3J6_9ACTN|nr:YdeI/OmpD-associated family protein [Streptomyces sp. HUAS YS2]WOX26238.1 YdeI/OmpD-associated family protein [Streptomyces sp. HUAS YS2]
MDTFEGLPVMTFTDRAGLEAWLEKHAGDSTGAWLRIARKGSDATSLPLVETLDCMLCFGWIDGQRRSGDERYYLQKYTPRRPRALWSQVNVRKVEALDAAGRMRERGLAEVRAAQADGRWAAAYPSQREATVPDDLAGALAADDRARASFEGLGRTDQYLVILRLWQARTPENREQRLERMMVALTEGRKPV